MDEYQDIGECLIGFFVNNVCCKQLAAEPKFNIRLSIWIIVQLGLLLYFQIHFYAYHDKMDYKIWIPLIVYCCLVTYYIQSCEEKYIYYGKLDLTYRKKKLKIIDFCQNLVVIILQLIQRYAEDQETLVNLLTLIIYGFDSLLNIIEIIRLQRSKKQQQETQSYGGTKCIYYGTFIGLIPAIILTVIIFPADQITQFEKTYWIMYCQLFSQILIALVLMFKIYRYKKPKQQTSKTLMSKGLLLLIYGLTQGFYQLYVSFFNVVYQIYKKLFKQQEKNKIEFDSYKICYLLSVFSKTI